MGEWYIHSFIYEYNNLKIKIQRDNEKGEKPDEKVFDITAHELLKYFNDKCVEIEKFKAEFEERFGDAQEQKGESK